MGLVQTSAWWIKRGGTVRDGWQGGRMEVEKKGWVGCGGVWVWVGVGWG